MTVASDIVDFRTDNSCSIQQLPDATALRYYNDCRDILIDRIIQEKEDFFYNEIRTNLVAGQREYIVPKRGELPTGALVKTKGISIKFKATDTYYTKLDPTVMENLDYDLLSYDKTTSPFFVMSDNSNFLYPTPTEDITNGMIIYGIMYPEKLALTDEETLPNQHKKAILLGMAERYFTSQGQGKYNEATIAGNKFNIEIERVAKSLSGRIQSPKQIETGDLSIYC